MWSMMYMQLEKTTMKEFTYEHSIHYGCKFRNIFYNTNLEFYVFVLYNFNSMHIN